jgi:predicted transcriptional regulator
MVRNERPSAEGLLGPLEYDVISVLWAAGPANVPVVLEQVNAGRQDDKALAYTTVMTVLARLYEKGLLSRQRRGRGYEYRPQFDEAELVAHLSRREVDELLARYGHVALAQFAAAVDEADPALLGRVRALARGDDA